MNQNNPKSTQTTFKTDNHTKPNDRVIPSTSRNGIKTTNNNSNNNRANKRKHEDDDVIVIESDNEVYSKNRYILSIIEELGKCRNGDEIKIVLKILQPTRDDLLIRFTKVKKDLEYLLAKMLRNFELVVFGSIVSGLAFRDSDADFYVRLPSDNVNSATSFIFQLKRLVESHGYFKVTEAITGAKVPILRTMHIQTQMDCDINFTSPQGYFNSCFINFMMNFDERIHNLAVIIKYWIGLNRHHVEQKQLNSYCIVNLLLYYLQQLELPIVPPVFVLQLNVAPVKYGPWNFAYDKSFCSKRRNTMNEYELLEGFFKFYATFDYAETIICPLYGRVFDRDYFPYNLNKNPRIFQEFRTYAYAIEQLRYQRIQTRTPLCVQDPFELNNNVAKSCLAKTLKQWVVLNKFAVNICEECVDESKSEFLTRLFTESPPVLVVDVEIVPTSSKKPKLN